MSGRLLDLMNQGFVSLRDVEMFVLDEADRMLDMGFLTDVKKIISHLPHKRQTLFFSATMPKEIVRLADTILHDPVKITITPDEPTVDAIKQYVFFVDKAKKKDLLLYVLDDDDIKTALVFTRQSMVLISWYVFSDKIIFAPKRSTAINHKMSASAHLITSKRRRQEYL